MGTLKRQAAQLAAVKETIDRLVDLNNREFLPYEVAKHVERLSRLIADEDFAVIEYGRRINQVTGEKRTTEMLLNEYREQLRVQKALVQKLIVRLQEHGETINVQLGGYHGNSNASQRAAGLAEPGPRASREDRAE